MANANKTFTYGGYTFEPRGTFKDFGIKPGKNNDYSDVMLYLYDINDKCVADGKEKFNYDDFYKASGNSTDDVFYCEETGEMYVPCNVTLQVFDQDARSSKEVERRYKFRTAPKTLWSIFDGEITYDDIQDFADEFTNRLMHAKYGERFDLCDNLEDDDDMNRDWDYLNDKIFGMIDTWTD